MSKSLYFGARISYELREALKEQAAKEERSEADIVRRAVKAYIKNNAS